MNLWDTAGLDRAAGTMSGSYFSKASAVLLVYDVADQCSFRRLEIWLQNALQYEENFEPFIVGNKIDLNDTTHEVAIGNVLDFAGRNFIPMDSIFRISAKTGEGFSDLFDKIAQVLADECTPTNYADRSFKIEDRLLDDDKNSKCWSKCKC